MSLRLLSSSPSPGPFSSSVPPCIFSCRIVSIEWYTTNSPIKELDICYSHFRSSPVEKVPIIRIFGSTPLGQKTCLHVHGVFPYLYVPCTCRAHPNNDYLQLVARSIDHALQISLGSASANVQHVFKIVLAKGKPFYGYHEDVKLFLKIYLYNPALIKRLADLLISGAVMNQVLQPHESHIPFVLQFMIDHNLFGMNHIHLANVKFRITRSCDLKSRSPSPRTRSVTSPLSPVSPLSPCSSILFHPSQTLWNVDSLPCEKLVCIPRVSVCELEADAIGADILNKHELSLVAGGFPGLAAIWEEERQRRQLLQMDTPLTPPQSPERCSQPYPAAEKRFQKELEEILEERLHIREGSDEARISPEMEFSDTNPFPSGSSTTDVIVNDDLVHQSLSLSQRCSADAIEKSTDVELIELMNELCQTPRQEAGTRESQPSSASQYLLLSQHQIPPSQSAGEALIQRIRRSHSRSLFSSSSPSPQPDSNSILAPIQKLEPAIDPDRVQPNSNPMLAPIQNLELQAVDADRDRRRSKEEKEKVDASERHLSPVYTEHLTGGISANLLDMSFCSTASEENTLMENSSQNSCSRSEGATNSNRELVVSIKLDLLPIKQEKKAVLGEHVSQQRQALTDDDQGSTCPETTLNIEKEMNILEVGEVGEGKVDNPMPAFPHTNLFPLTQETKELEDLLTHELDNFSGGTVGDELDEMAIKESSPFSITCGQPVLESPNTTALWGDMEPILSNSGSGSETPIKLDAGSKNSTPEFDHGIQLEYDIPEVLPISQMEQSGSSFASVLGSVSPEKVFHRRGGSSCSQARKQLLCLVMSDGAASNEGVWGGDEVMVEGEGEEGDRSVDSSEEEHIEMSQLVWDKGFTVLRSGQKPKETSPRSIFDTISQLDGTPPPPPPPPPQPPTPDTPPLSPVPTTSAPPKKQRRKRQTLGVRRKVHKKYPLPIVETSGKSQPVGIVQEAAAVIGSKSSCPDSGVTVVRKRRRLSLSLKGKSQPVSIVQEEATGVTGSKSICPDSGITVVRKRGRPSLSLKRKTQRDTSTNVSEDKVSSNPNSSVRKQVLLRQLEVRVVRIPVNPGGSVGGATSKKRVSPRKKRLRRESELNYRKRLKLAMELSEADLVSDPRSTKVPSGVRSEVNSNTGYESSVMDNFQSKSDEFSSESAEPQATNAEPRATNVEPQATTVEVTNTDPWATDAEPQAINAELQVTNTDPRAMDAEPQVINTDPQEAINVEPSTTPTRYSPSEGRGKVLEREESPQSSSYSDTTPLLSPRKPCIVSQGETMISDRVSPPPSPSHSESEKDTLEADSVSLGFQLCRSPEKDWEDVHSPVGNLIHEESILDYADSSEFEEECVIPDPESNFSLQMHISSESDSGSPEDDFSLLESSGPSKTVQAVTLKPVTLETQISDSKRNVLHSVTEQTCNDTSDMEIDTPASEEGVVISKHFATSSPLSGKIWTPSLSPPSAEMLSKSASSYGLPSAVHIKPFYSNPADVQLPKVVGGRTIKVTSTMPYDFKEFDPPSTNEDPTPSFSHSGLAHMRVTLGVFFHHSTNMHPYASSALFDPVARETSKPHCLLSDYKHDMDLRANSFLQKKTIITPASLPPSPRKLAAALEYMSIQEEQQTVTEAHSNYNKTESSTLTSVSPPISVKSSTLTSVSPPISVKSSTLTSVSPPISVKSSTLTSVSPPISVKSSTLTSVSPPISVKLTDETALVLEHSLELSPAAGVTHQRHSTPKERSASIESDEGGGAIQRCGQTGKGGVQGHGQTPVRSKLQPEVGEDSAKKSHCGPFSPNMSALKRDTSQLEGPTPANSYGFKISQSGLCASHNIHEVQYLTSLSVEVHVHTRGKLRPDPEFDPVLAIFYFIHNDWPRPDGSPGENTRLGVLAIDIDNAAFTSFIGKVSPCKNSGATPTKSPNKATRATATPTKSPSGATATPIKSPTGVPSRSPTGAAATPTKSPTGATTTPTKNPTGAAVTPTKSPTGATATPIKDDVHSVDGAKATPDKVGKGYLSGCGLHSNVEVKYVTSEHELLESLVWLVREVDPDFLIGYEVVMSSWGYLIDRAAAINVNLVNQLSRMPKPYDSRGQSATSSTLPRKPFNLRVPGRIVLNVWRFMRSEVALNIYTFENLCFHVLHRRLPFFSHRALTTWYNSKIRAHRYRVLDYYLERCHSNFVLLDKFNLISRTSEFARLYGIEFENVANRGSQYKVESMMLRLAKPADYIAVSPSVQQRARMAAPECIPLILEPESKFYEDPVLVLDFQSLYPSMVIAYNYCYSTCLGRFQNLAVNGDYKFGTNRLSVSNSVLKKLRGKFHVSPNGIAFVKKTVRKGILPIMLEEILGTRIMVKNSMKKHKNDKLLQRLLNSRQLALKLVANTTFGYTAASYSGRMPCIEIADSIVEKGRETLERAIQLVNSTPKWKGRVVYGDTDSLFVLLKGVSKDEAFQIGKDICARVAEENPKPVKLKFEKVYLPCILESKKRYVGYSYESSDQQEPIFDAKGIETVRRDSCPAVPKVLEKCLKLLFESRDLSLVKSYVQRQFKKLIDGKVNIQDYTFAKEYRGREYYRPGGSAPALELTKSSLAVDRRSEPRPGERVPYVIVYGTPGQPLIRLVRRPQELMEQPALRLNATYYITKQLIPPLDRALSLLGVDVREWYFEMPKITRSLAPVHEPSRRLRGTIGQYFATRHCPVCDQLTLEGVCNQCSKDPQKVTVHLNVMAQQDQRSSAEIADICSNCIGSRDPDHYLQCESLDCPVLYRRFRAQQDMAHTQQLLKSIDM